MKFKCIFNNISKIIRWICNIISRVTLMKSVNINLKLYCASYSVCSISSRCITCKECNSAVFLNFEVSKVSLLSCCWVNCSGDIKCLCRTIFSSKLKCTHIRISIIEIIVIIIEELILCIHYWIEYNELSVTIACSACWCIVKNLMVNSVFSWSTIFNITLSCWIFGCWIISWIISDCCDIPTHCVIFWDIWECNYIEIPFNLSCCIVVIFNFVCISRT